MQNITKIQWKKETLHRKYDKNQPKMNYLMTECIECIDYVNIYIGYVGDILDVFDILYIQEAHLL